MQNNLIRLRKEAGLSQEELADKLAVSRQAVSKWERGEALPDTDNLIRLARLYNVSIDEIVGYAPEKETSADENKAAGGADDAGHGVQGVQGTKLGLDGSLAGVKIELGIGAEVDAGAEAVAQAGQAAVGPGLDRARRDPE